MPSALEIIEDLIGFDTTSRGSNLALIEYARGLIEAAGGRVRLTFDDTRAKANLFATIGPDAPGGYVLSGHTDVVPVDGQSWSSDPFRAEARDGKLFGRGAADMKGFVGAALSMLPRMRAAQLKRPIHFAFSYDEEVGCIGVQRLIADLKDAGIKPGLAVIGEPTGMAVVGAHKGGAVIHTHAHGLEGHSSAPDKGANAVMMAGEFIALIASEQEKLKSVRDARFDPPYTTVQANMVAGGSAVNILARDARVTWEYRCLPDRDGAAIAMDIARRAEAEIAPRYAAHAPDARFSTEIVAQYPGLVLDENSPAIALARGLTGANEVAAVAYGTEAGHFQLAGIPAVICGPGSIDQAHRADEYVTLDQIAACEAFLEKLVARAAA